jgi:hypothetical protein
MAELRHALRTMLPARPRTGRNGGHLKRTERLGRHVTRRTIFIGIPDLSD